MSRSPWVVEGHDTQRAATTSVRYGTPACAIVNSRSTGPRTKVGGRWRTSSVGKGPLRCDRSKTPMNYCARRGARLGTSLNTARSAQHLSELERIDQLLTRDVFDALCSQGIPMPLVSELVWPAVAALEQQASALETSWRPALCQGDWLMPDPRQASKCRSVEVAPLQRLAHLPEHG